MLKYYLETKLYWNYIFEFLAALAGLFYLRSSAGSTRSLRIFARFLWVILLVEIIGLYTSVGYFSNYRYFSFIKDTPFERNFWLYNIMKIFSYLVYLNIFISELKTVRFRKILRKLSLAFAVAAALNLIFSDVLFIEFSAFTFITGTTLLFLAVAAFYYDTLRSDRVLRFHCSLECYISVGALLWHLCITPLFIYSEYFSLKSPDFVEFHMTTLRWANVVMYSLFAVGFIVQTVKRPAAFSEDLAEH